MISRRSLLRGLSAAILTPFISAKEVFSDTKQFGFREYCKQYEGRVDFEEIERVIRERWASKVVDFHVVESNNVFTQWWAGETIPFRLPRYSIVPCEWGFTVPKDKKPYLDCICLPAKDNGNITQNSENILLVQNKLIHDISECLKYSEWTRNDVVVLTSKKYWNVFGNGAIKHGYLQKI